MASPDFSDYIDLTVNDLQPGDVFNASVDYARIAFPEFEPRVGSVEDAIMQTFAFMTSIYSAAANRIPNGTIEGVLRLFGLERREAGVGTIEVEFTLLSQGGVIEEGTSVYHVEEVNGELLQYPFALMQKIEANVDSNTVTATLESIVLGNLPSIPAGTPLILAQPSSEILSCVIVSPPVSGDVSETDAEYLQRGVTYLDSLSQALCTPRQIESYILSVYPEVTRCRIVDLSFSAGTMPSSSVITDISEDEENINVAINISNGDQSFAEFVSSRGITVDAQPCWISTPALYGSESITSDIFPSGLLSTDAAIPASIDYEPTTKVITFTMTPETPSSESNIGETSIQLLEGLTFDELSLGISSRLEDPRGIFTIFLWGKDGKPVSATQKQTIKSDLDSKIPIGTTYFIYDAMPVDIYCSISVEILDGFVGSSVVANVSQLLEDYFSPQNYPNWSQFLYTNEVIAKASSVQGVKRVVAVSMSNPAYGGTGEDITPTTNSSFYNNISMAEDSDPDFIQFVYAGTLPKMTPNVSIA
jgi:hypothetical protein